MSLISATGSLLSAQQVGPQNDRVDVLIGFRSTPDAADEALVRGAGGEVKHRFHIVPAIAVRVPRAALAGLQRHPRVTVIEPDGEVFAIDEYDSAWGVARIGSETLHANGVRGAGVNVAVLDTGIAYTHPDLAANYAGGRDFVNNDNDPADDNNHGSHVSGTIAAVLNGTGVVGVAPSARLYGVKVLNASGSGSWSGIIAGVQWVVDNGIKITNNSYGGSGHPGSLVEAAFANSAAAGVLHIAAAGNSGTCAGNTDTVGYPAKFSSVVAVAATQVNDTRPCFSSTGPAVELAAPGVNIVSTIRNNQYGNFSGTSMASPHVAGVAALLMGAGATSASQIRQILHDTALDIGATGRDTFYGFGLVDAAAAVAAISPGPPPAPEVNVSLTTNKSNYVQGTDTSVVLTAIVTDEDGGPITNIGTASFATKLDGNAVAATFTETPAASGVYVASLSLSGMSVGPHSVNVSVTDAGITGQDTASFSVSAATSNSVQVQSIAYTTYGGKGNSRHLLITVRVVDGNNAVVPNAVVGVAITRDGTAIGTSTGTTGTNGQVTFEIKNHSASSCYRTTVTSVSAGTRTWNGVTPSNGSAGCGS
jgi:subtilisin